MKRVIIKETHLNIIRKYLNEGVEWKKNSGGTVDFSFNNDNSDKGNSGSNNIDTRLFGDKKTILYGDNTKSKKAKSLYQYATSKNAMIQLYKNVIDFVNNGRVGGFDIPENVDKKTVTTINNWFSSGKSDRWIIDSATKAITRNTQESEPYINTVNRVQSSNNDKIARYKTGTVNGTGVKYIALFTMSDFNISDAIKHGKIRQGDLSDSLFGINKKERERSNNGGYSLIDVTYDNKYKPDISQNFSLKDVGDGHFKQQFGLNGDGGYSSVSQFLDKSVNYAAYALKNEHFIPDFIIAPPSSSNFNKYYCTNLSNKLGIPYKEDFFKRNIVNVKIDGKSVEEQMLNNGFSQKDIIDFQNQVKAIAYKEIAYFISEPIKNLVYSNQELFSNISKEHYEREKASIDDVFDCLMIYVYRTIVNNIESNNDIVEKHLINNLLSKQTKLYNKKYNSEHIFKQISNIITLKIGKKVFNSYMIKTFELVKQYSNILKETGYKLRFNTKRFKVTQVPKQYRPYLNGVYIIADNYMNDGKLMSQFRNAKFLIFDEDINSGATLKLCIDALEEKIPEAHQNNILCLVNAYSSSGW